MKNCVFGKQKFVIFQMTFQRTFTVFVDRHKPVVLLQNLSDLTNSTGKR